MTKKPVDTLKDFANEQVFGALLTTYRDNIKAYMREENHNNDLANKIRGNVGELLDKHAKRDNGCGDVLQKTMETLLTKDTLATKKLVMDCIGAICANETNFKSHAIDSLGDRFNECFQTLYKSGSMIKPDALSCINKSCATMTKGGNISMLKEPINTILENEDDSEIVEILLSLTANAKESQNNSEINDIAVTVASKLLDIVAENEVSESPDSVDNNSRVELISRLIEERNFDVLNSLSEKLESVVSSLGIISSIKNVELTTPAQLIASISGNDGLN